MSNIYMQKAIDIAWKYQFLTYPNPAVGATVVKDDKILSVEAHKKAGEPHAEVLALKEAYLKIYPNSDLQSLTSSSDIHNFLIKNHNGFFKDCQIYVTLEPCNHIGKTPACAMLLEAIEIQKVYIAIKDPNPKATGGIERLQKASIDVVVGIEENKAYELLYPFISWTKDKFCFFKLAMREDGTIDGGYITTKESLKLVHKLRTKIDLLLIGGNTVKTDRPTLDTRYISSPKVPDVYIYSHQKNFDTTIPLFQIPNRDVTIGDNLNILDTKKFIMIEGGYNLLDKVIDRCDLVMLFISHKLKSDSIYDITKKYNLKKVYSYFINEYDEVVFFRKKRKLLVSSCLLGEKVKYNGKDNKLSDEILEKLSTKYQIFSFCPEVEGGLATPRIPCEVVSSNPLKVINKIGEDKTKEFLKGAKKNFTTM